VVVDDHVGAHGVLRELRRDLLSRSAPGAPVGVLSRTTPVNPSASRISPQLGDGLAVPPGGRDDDIREAARQSVLT
jgi:hypothetical protein